MYNILQVMFIRSLLIIALSVLLQSSPLANEKLIDLKPVKNLPYSQSTNLMLDSNDYDTVILQLETKKSGTARFFWATSYNQQFNAPKSVWFKLKKGEHLYYLNLPSQNPNWLGWITGFLLYPETGQIKIKQAKLVRGNLLSNIKSGWQEFWGPKGRQIIGSTINVIFSPTLFGHSINTYIYWLLLIYLLYLVGNQLKKGSFSWDRTGRKLIFATIFFWALLELSSSYNYWHIFQTDLKAYAGKTASEKAAASVGKDFYNFLTFCQEKIPANNKRTITLIVPDGRHDLWMKAKYYAFPLQIKDFTNTEIEPDFVLVYKNSKNSYSNNLKYKILAKLKNNQYILRKK